MLDDLLVHITNKVNTYLRNRAGDEDASITKIILEDISKQDLSTEGENDDLSSKIFLTLVNIEEETSLKNNYPTQRIDSSIIQLDPAVHINICLLFAAKHTNYRTALQQISRVIEFFQFNKTMNINLNKSYEIRFNLYNIGFENLNNLWTTLGGRYLPSVIYKVRLLIYQKTPPTTGPAIMEVEHSDSFLD